MTSDLTLGFLGNKTGTTWALMAAAELGREIKADVWGGGRVDMAGEKLGGIKAPTLFILGGDDKVVLQLNEKALSRVKM